MKEIRLILQGKDEENFASIKKWLNEKKDTRVLRTLLTEKYQEIKRIQFLGRSKKPTTQDQSIETVQEEPL